MRILIADDNELVRRGIRRLLSREDHWEICAEVSDGRQALEKAIELRPDLVLLDINMPASNGFETARGMKQQVPGVKVLILSQQDEAQLLPSALEAGAHGCVDKARLASDLIGAIKKVQSETMSAAASDES